jgi:uncharacterized membrane protein
MAKSRAPKKHRASTSSIRETVDVDVPLSTAYHQWTQFEEFPRFMEGVESIRQLDDCRLRWTACVGGKTVEWQAKITEQVPDVRVAWRSVSGARNAGAVTFDRLADRSTRITLELEYEPEGLAENLADFLVLASRRAKGDLARFKELIEKRGHETGVWRGRIPSPESSTH